jgi:uncharacterized protein (TIGR03435 family)
MRTYTQEMKPIRCGVLALAASAGLLAQPAQRPEFEVVSIRPTGELPAQVQIGVHIDGAQVKCNYFSLKDLIQSAYQLKNYQVIAPDWVAAERFDVAAKLPDGAPRDQVPAMLQSMLEDRFKLKAHKESREFPVYGLVVAKSGLKMKESPEDPADPQGGRRGDVNVNVTGGRGGVNINYGGGSYFSFADNKLEGRKLPMPRFADTLARFMDRPVVDMTELKGNYDFTLEFTPEDYQAMLIRSAVAAGVSLPPQALKLMEMSSGDSLTSALAMVGLKLESRKAPLPVLVIDHMEKMPSDN